jgi:AraC family transcriptional activator FtrA
MNNVSILAYDKVSLFELACAVELFAIPRPEFAQWYQTDVVTFSESPLSLVSNLSFTCKTVTDLDHTDLLIIPSWPVEQVEVDPVLSETILKLYSRGGRIVSFCSGSFLLARLGLLNGRTATTHWRYADEFKQQFPAVGYVDDVLYVHDGQIGCSAGSASAIDLGIEVIRQDFGFEFANAVARRLVLPAHRTGGQKQYVEKVVNQDKNHFSSALEWAATNLDSELSIDQLAQRANMTRRTFDRRFRQTFNQTATQWLILQKLDLAKGLLESSNENLERIATNSGFNNAITLRHNFNKYLAISPSRYRDQFRQNL